MCGEVVAIGDVEDCGPIRKDEPVLAAHFVAAPAAAWEVLIRVCQGCQHFLGVGQIIVRDSLCVVLQKPTHG